MKSVITVIICTRNRSDLLIQCLNELVSGNVTAEKIIIVDSSSNNETEKVIKSTVAWSNASILYKKIIHKNVAHSRNVGLKLATSQIIAFIDDDAIPDSHWIENIQATYLKRKDVMGVGGLVQNIESSYWSNAAALIYKHNIEVQISNSKNNTVYAFAGVNCSFRRDFLSKKKILFNEDFSTGEDVMFCYDVIRAGGKLLYDPSIKVKHRFRTNFFDFVRRYYEYALDEYHYCINYPEFSSIYAYIPSRKLFWLLFPFYISLRFFSYLINYIKPLLSKNFIYIPAVGLFLLVHYMGFYQQYIKDTLLHST